MPKPTIQKSKHPYGDKTLEIVFPDAGIGHGNLHVQVSRVDLMTIIEQALGVFGLVENKRDQP